MEGKRILILGGGFGGITAALTLRRALGPEHRITLVDRGGAFFMGLRKLWVMDGRGTLAEGTRSLDHLAAEGVDVRRGTVEAIDAPGRTVRVDGDSLSFDYLIVAMGAEPRPDLVPGFADNVFNLYTPEGVERLAAHLSSFNQGHVHIAVLGVPYKCPPAPYEAAMLLHDYFQQRGSRAAITIETSTPQPMSLPVVGAAGCAQVEGLLAERNIGFTPNRKPTRVEGTTVMLEEGEVPADLLIGVPPHRPPSVVAESGFELRGPWVAVDPASMRTSVEGVFAVGDVVEIPLANGLPLPKAGILAEQQAKAAAGAIIGEITGRPAADAFDGRGYCFIEVGGGQAAMVRGAFLATPGPDVQIEPPSVSGYQEKVEFERSRLSSWFTGQR